MPLQFTIQCSELTLVLLQLTTAWDSDEMVICLNRGDFLFDTSDDELYPRNPEGTTLTFTDGDDRVSFYKQNAEDVGNA